MSDKEVGYAELFSGSSKGGESKEFSAVFTSSIKSIDVEKRQVRVLASDATIDRDGERILPTAFKNHLETYRKNPVILACHQHRLQDGSSPVVGRCVRVWIDKKCLWSIIEFAETALGEEYWQLYSRGFMKAVSVGFNPLQWSDEIEDGRRIRICEEAELLEISCVPVPSNPNALVKGSKRGKAQFVGAKSEEKILDQVRQENPNFDAECKEFADCLMGVCDIKESENIEYDFAEKFNEESSQNEHDYASIFE